MPGAAPSTRRALAASLGNGATIAGERHEPHRQGLARAHPALGVLLDQHQMLQGKAAAHGNHHDTAGFSCWIKGGGTCCAAAVTTMPSYGAASGTP